jgi:hypothetical protein
VEVTLVLVVVNEYPVNGLKKSSLYNACRVETKQNKSIMMSCPLKLTLCENCAVYVRILKNYFEKRGILLQLAANLIRQGLIESIDDFVV